MDKKILIIFALSFAVLAFVEGQGDPEKPVWPAKFEAAFGLNIIVPPTRNASSRLYYNWLIKKQVIDYHEHCIPLAGPTAWFYPCKLYFEPSGIYISIPKLGVTCCSAIPGVGSIPTDFLTPFNYSNVESVFDLYGTPHKTNHWVADDFAYWTDVDTGSDIQFKDGPTGIFWNFEPTLQGLTVPDNFFDLPTNPCTAPCFGIPLDAQHSLTRMRSFLHKVAPVKPH